MKESNGTAHNNKIVPNNKEWPLAAWNVRGFNGKEVELAEEFVKNQIDVLGITDTKKKGKCTQFLENRHFLITNGVSQSERAKEGVGCLINSNLIKNIKDWDCTYGRILKIRLVTIEHKLVNIIIMYGINVDEKAARKTYSEIWSQRYTVLGNLNGRVGVRDKYTPDVLGPYREEKKTTMENVLLIYVEKII
ncbi:uncharacterized protein [Diabrotica undecimpunctata]|uniref:uncharacterized protein n=1 Tax=Diabrotica undecimpunctata TaxID=50387 RepID=UPI003B641E1E